MKLFLVLRSRWGYDDGVVGVFSSKEKATAFVEANRLEFGASWIKDWTPDMFIDDTSYELDEGKLD